MKKGWQTKTLADICSFENGDRGTNYPSRSAQTSHGIPFINAGHLTDAGIDIERLNFIPRERFDLLSNGKIRRGDILFCLRGSLGKFASVGSLSEGAIASSLVIVRPGESVLGGYMLAYFQSDLCADMINRFKNGAAQPNLSAQSLSRFTVPVPPLPEQQRIVGILDEAFERIATATANAEVNLHNARALFESGLNSTTTGALTKDWRRGHPNTESASAHLIRRLAHCRSQWKGTGKYPEPDSPVTTNPIALPKTWALASPEQISTHIVDCPHSTPKWAKSGVLCLRTTNFKPGFLDLESVQFVSEETYKERIMRLEPKSGDVLYSREGGILGIACIIPEQLKACLGQRMMLFRLDTDIALPEYFSAVLNSTMILSEVRRLTGGAASPHLNIRDIRTFRIPLPPISEQRQIIAKLDIISTETRRLASLYQRKLAALEALKKSLLHQAFTGGL